MLHAVDTGKPLPVAAVVAYTPCLSLPRPWSVDLPPGITASGSRAGYHAATAAAAQDEVMKFLRR